MTRALAAGLVLVGLAALAATGCGGGAGTGSPPPTAPPPNTETVTVTYRDATNGSTVDGRVAYIDANGNPAAADTGATITLLAGTRISIEAAGYSRKETDATSRVDGAYWGIPAALQAEIDQARGAGGLRRPGLDRPFDVVIDRLTFSKAEADAVQTIMEAAAPTVTAARYAWTRKRRDDPSQRPGTYAVLVAGAGTFDPLLDGSEILGGRVGINPSTRPGPRFDGMVRLAAARMVGFRGGSYSDDQRV